MSHIRRFHSHRRKTDHSLPSSADIVNVWSNTVTDSNRNGLSIQLPESIANFWIRISFLNFIMNVYLIDIFISQTLKFTL